MLVSEVMHQGVKTANINDTARKVAELMRREDVGAVPVMEEDRVVGFVTDRDIVVSIVADGTASTDPISNVMNDEVISIQASQDMDEALRLMEENQISRLLVMDAEERPVGMLSLQDMSQHLPDELNAEVLARIKQ